MHVSSAWMDQQIIFYILWIKPKILKWHKSSFRLFLRVLIMFMTFHFLHNRLQFQITHRHHIKKITVWLPGTFPFLNTGNGRESLDNVFFIAFYLEEFLLFLTYVIRKLFLYPHTIIYATRTFISWSIMQHLQEAGEYKAYPKSSESESVKIKILYLHRCKVRFLQMRFLYDIH
jgi:hypothetical protein